MWPAHLAPAGRAARGGRRRCQRRDRRAILRRRRARRAHRRRRLRPATPSAQVRGQGLPRAHGGQHRAVRTALPAALLSPVTTASSCFPAGLLFGDSGDSAVGDSSPDSAALNVGELAPSAVASSSTTAGGPAAAALPSSSSRAPSPSSPLSSSCRPSSSDSEMSGLLRDR
eukprot:COSAG04_NODE_3338_length_2915_cov_1.732599_4_plen_171_part_00